MAGLEAGRVQGYGDVAHIVCRATRLKRLMVVGLRPPAPARLSVRGDRDPVAGNRGHDDVVLPQFDGRWKSARAVFGEGELRDGVEPLDLAVELRLLQQNVKRLVRTRPKLSFDWGGTRRMVTNSSPQLGVSGLAFDDCVDWLSVRK